jgi:hypothetical protein
MGLFSRSFYAINVTYLGLLFLIGTNLNVYAENLVTCISAREGVTGEKSFWQLVWKST